MPEVIKHLLRAPQGAAGLFILLLALLMVVAGGHIGNLVGPKLRELELSSSP